MFGRKESAAPPRPGLGVPGVPGQEGVEPELAAMLLRGNTYPANPSGTSIPNPRGIFAISPGCKVQS